MSRILALDPSKYTGWAVGAPDDDPEEYPIYGTRTFEGSRAGKQGPSLYEFGYWFEHMIERHDVEAVAFEKPYPRQDNATVWLISQAALIQYLSVCNGLPCEGIYVATIRSYFCPKGQKKKKYVTDLCRQRGWAPADDNQADALALWEYYVHKTNPEAAKRFALANMNPRPDVRRDIERLI